MITSDDILSLNFYNYGNPFTGSYQGMRYRIINALKTTQLFPFSEEGKAQVIEWLNASWEKGIYKNETI